MLNAQERCHRQEEEHGLTEEGTGYIGPGATAGGAWTTYIVRIATCLWNGVRGRLVVTCCKFGSEGSRSQLS